MAFLFILFVLTTIIAISLTLFLMGKRILIRRKLSDAHRIHKNCVILAFFHPYCNSGGGGERVLWTGISAILQRYFSYPSHCLTFSLLVDILKLKALSRIQFVPLITEPLLRPSQYPHFTLAGQALGSVIAALEAVFRRPPDIFLDTTGFSFTMPIFAWLAGSACGAYVHFPTISSDMEIRVEGTAYNNSEEIRRNKFLTAAKLAYYYIFKKAYCWSGSKPNCELAAVNSSWTKNHISRMWGGSPVLLYPPCPVEHLIDKKTSAEGRKPWIISVGQFRPEKNHRVSDLFIFFLTSGYIGHTTRYLEKRVREHITAWLGKCVTRSLSSSILAHRLNTYHRVDPKKAFQVFYQTPTNFSKGLRQRVLATAEVLAIWLTNLALCCQKTLVQALFRGRQPLKVAFTRRHHPLTVVVNSVYLRVMFNPHTRLYLLPFA
ncbi:unnamed protein product [Schistocephalus solidus]|uniref:ALG11_N domain-containing protein n=1 Tax=Schistocephalus solidus TaxID=70667 RepID=A0A183TRR7_SCHSO|nr:unnamed protein product [Schistocephalus solidus]